MLVAALLELKARELFPDEGESDRARAEGERSKLRVRVYRPPRKVAILDRRAIGFAEPLAGRSARMVGGRAASQKGRGSCNIDRVASPCLFRR